jgi:hypothetical protein
MGKHLARGIGAMVQAGAAARQIRVTPSIASRACVSKIGQQKTKVPYEEFLLKVGGAGVIGHDSTPRRAPTN